MDSLATGCQRFYHAIIIEGRDRDTILRTETPYNHASPGRLPVAPMEPLKRWSPKLDWERKTQHADSAKIPF